MSEIRVGLRRRTLLASAFVFAALLLLMVETARRLEREGQRLIEQSQAALERLGRAALEADADQLAGLLGETLANPLAERDLRSIRDLVRSVLTRPEVQAILVFDAEGSLVHDGSDAIPNFGQRLWDPLLQRILRGEAEQDFAWRGDVLVSVRGVRRANRSLGGVLIEMSASAVAAAIAESKQVLTATLVRARREQQKAALLLLLLFSLLVPLALLWVSRRVVAPVRRMVERARAIELGQPLPALEAKPPDELGVLADAFESMRLGVERQQRANRERALSDELTGLANRRGFEERAGALLNHAKAHEETLALLFLDLDGFKRINDLHGHEEGDRALVEVGLRLRAAIEETPMLVEASVVVARIGGDEFVVVFVADKALWVAESLARRFLAKLRRPIVLSRGSAELGVSVGIAMYPEDAHTLAELLRCADLAMYQVKLGGKNDVRRHHARAKSAHKKRAELELELRSALERGELLLHFQPIFDLRDRRPLGAEALLRWNHRDRGLLRAGCFWSALADSPLLEELTPWSLRAACSAARSWSGGAEQKGPFVAVNLAGRAMLNGKLGEEVHAALKATGLPPGRLHLELSEPAAIVRDRRLAAQLQALRALGVRLWLDDDGGDLQLSWLRQLALDGVKLDRRFVAALLSDQDDRAIAEAILAMTRAFGLPVIAEGIERSAQVRALLERRCELGQGDWLSQPLPPAAIRELFAGDAR